MRKGGNRRRVLLFWFFFPNSWLFQFKNTLPLIMGRWGKESKHKPWSRQSLQKLLCLMFGPYMDGRFGEPVVGSVLCPQLPSEGWVMQPGNAEAWGARGRGWEMGISGSQRTAHNAQSKIPEENWESSSAPSVPRPIASSSSSRSRDVHGNNYYIWVLVLFWDSFFFFFLYLLDR